MSKYSVGKDVLSHCTRCKLKLSHIIVTMKDANTIHKVQCRTCNSTHAYKDPSMAAVKKTRTTSTRVKAPTVPVEQVWLEEINKSTASAKKYTIKGNFNKGDVIDHVKFGQGIVQNIVDDKIEVLFKSDIKLLVHNK